MRRLLPLLPLALAAPVAAGTVSPPHLAGVSDEETTIPSGTIEQFVRGKGDVLFVRDRTAHWYRLTLNAGCLKAAPSIDAVTFDFGGAATQIDRFTRVTLDGPDPRTCAIASIRASVPPPQVDSKSPVTLD